MPPMYNATALYHAMLQLPQSLQERLRKTEFDKYTANLIIDIVNFYETQKGQTK